MSLRLFSGSCDTLGATPPGACEHLLVVGRLRSGLSGAAGLSICNRSRRSRKLSREIAPTLLGASQVDGGKGVALGILLLLNLSVFDHANGSVCLDLK